MIEYRRFYHLVVVVAALHLTVFSWVVGVRSLGYFLAGTFSATLIWGMIFLSEDQFRRKHTVLGSLLGIVVQQLAYQITKSELTSFCWSFAQFGALHFLVAYGLKKTAL